MLKDYSFNADFKGCTPESITPDTVTIIVTQECGDSTIRHYMRLGAPFSVERITPNPTTNQLNVDVLSSVSDAIAYQIVGITGSVVKSGPELRTSLDTQDLRAGVYYLRLEQQGIVVTKRFVVER